MKLMKFAAAATVLLIGLAASARAQDDAALYKAKCQSCHGASGKGDTPAGQKIGAKDLHSPEVAKLSDTELFDIVKKGKAKMPAYSGKLTDDQIKSLVKFIHTLK